MNYRLLSVFILTLILSTIFGCRSNHNENAAMPILLLASDEHFGTYTQEILLTEGFNEFEVARMKEDLELSFLEQYDIVVLPQTEITEKQGQALTKYVENGGNLIAFRPDRKISALFGISSRGDTISEAYISIDASTQAGIGLPADRLQFHGHGDLYTLSGGTELAAFYADPARPANAPAVVTNTVGKGKAFAFLYNLPESIVLTRQGNYANATKEMDGITGIRAMDLFTNGWVDTTKNTLNQADEQMRLFSRCIEWGTMDKRPLPRFWYFPDSLHCLVTLNNDGEDSKEEEFTPQFEDVDAKGAKMTLYIKEPDYVSAEWVKRWQDKGFEIAGHPDDTKQATSPDWNTMDSVIKDLKKRMNDKYGIKEFHTNTNHWFVWVGSHPDSVKDFSALAKIEELNNIGLDCNYAHYDNGSNQGHFLGAMGEMQGNYTGSGLPMKFADMNGKTINVYQQLNNVYDQQYMENKDQDGYYNAFKGLMDRSLNKGVYSYISVRAHNNEYFFSKVPLMKMLDYANSKKIPVWTEVKLLEFLRAKDEARFTGITWKENTLRFTLKSTISHSHGISFLLPAIVNGHRIQDISRNGATVDYRMESIKGVACAMVTVSAGQDYQFEIKYIK